MYAIAERYGEDNERSVTRYYTSIPMGHGDTYVWPTPNIMMFRSSGMSFQEGYNNDWINEIRRDIWLPTLGIMLENTPLHRVFEKHKMFGIELDQQPGWVVKNIDSILYKIDTQSKKWVVPLMAHDTIIRMYTTDNVFDDYIKEYITAYPEEDCLRFDMRGPVTDEPKTYKAANEKKKVSYMFKTFALWRIVKLLQSYCYCWKQLQHVICINENADADKDKNIFRRKGLHYITEFILTHDIEYTHPELGVTRDDQKAGLVTSSDAQNIYKPNFVKRDTRMTLGDFGIDAGTIHLDEQIGSAEEVDISTLMDKMKNNRAVDRVMLMQIDPIENEKNVQKVKRIFEPIYKHVCFGMVLKRKRKLSDSEPRRTYDLRSRKTGGRKRNRKKTTKKTTKKIYEKIYE